MKYADRQTDRQTDMPSLSDITYMHDLKICTYVNVNVKCTYSCQSLSVSSSFSQKAHHRKKLVKPKASFWRRNSCQYCYVHQFESNPAYYRLFSLRKASGSLPWYGEEAKISAINKIWGKPWTIFHRC
jgi:hypothetical protein